MQNAILAERLANWQPVGDQPQGTFALEQGWVLHLNAERTDSIGCRLQELVLERPESASAGSTPLMAFAPAVATRVRGLDETLAHLETDTDRGEALLRSAEPARDGTSVSYFEVRMQGRHRVSLKRYSADLKTSGSKRAIPFTLTHEGLAKVVREFTRD